MGEDGMLGGVVVCACVGGWMGTSCCLTLLMLSPPPVHPPPPQVASGGADKTIHVWDMESGHQAALLEGHQGGVTCIAYSPGGSKLASCASDK